MAEMAEKRENYATYAIYASANFYKSGMACRAMDDIRRNAALKYSERKVGFLRKDTSYRKKIQVVKRWTKKNRLANVAPSGIEREGNIYFSKLKP